MSINCTGGYYICTYVCNFQAKVEHPDRREYLVKTGQEEQTVTQEKKDEMV